MKTKLLLLTITSASLALAGCGDTTTTNTRNGNTVTNLGTNNANNIMVVNSNATNTVSTTNTNRWSNTNVTREEYDRNRADYERDRGTSTIGQGANDSWLWFKTRAALLSTNDLRESTVNVDVVNDVVTLKGTVASAAEKAKAEQVAKGIDGVKSVTNQLQVKPNDSMTNQMTNGAVNTRNANANANRR